MFPAISQLTDAILIPSVADPLEKDRSEALFEIDFLKRLLIHANRLYESIDDNALTVVIKKQILKTTALLVRSVDNKLNGLIDKSFHSLNGMHLNETEEMQILNGSPFNEYVMNISAPRLPKSFLSQIGGIPDSCGLHAVMHLLLSMNFMSNFFDFTEVTYQKAFAHGFNRLNNGQICTVMSEISDVLRSFADTLAAFVPPSRLYAAIGTKGINDYNFCDFLKPSIKANFALKKGVSSYQTILNRTTEMTLKESIIYDIERLSPNWLLFDIGIWCGIADGINLTITISKKEYKLHSFIVNIGMHYICCVIDTIKTERGPINVVRVYDDMHTNIVRTASLQSFSLNSVGALAYFRTS